MDLDAGYNDGEFERAVKAFYYCFYGPGYAQQRTRTLKNALKRFFRKHPNLIPIVSPPPGTSFAYKHMVVNLHRHWIKAGHRKLPSDYASLPMPSIDRCNRPAAKPVVRSSASPVPRKRPRHPSAPTVAAKEAFYKSWEWRTVRMEVLKQQGAACKCCGARPGDRTVAGGIVRVVVDHIKPLSKFWSLRLDRANLQVLCDECNQGKGAWDQTDWREPANDDTSLVDPAILEQLRYVI